MKIHRSLHAPLICAALIACGCSTAPERFTPFTAAASAAGADLLASWNDGPAKKAIVDFVKTTTDKNNAKFVPPEQRYR